MPSDSFDVRPAAIEVRTPARIHLGMLAFGQAAARSYGGVGFMLDRPGMHIRLRRSARLEARGPQAERAIRFARTCALAWNLAEAPCSIEVVSAPRCHVGLGSGTQLGLAVAAGMRQLLAQAADDPIEPIEGLLPAPIHPLQRPLQIGDHELLFDTPDAIEFARVVGRGRRSCIGVYGFSRGGLIVEAGRVVTAAPMGEDDATREFSPVVGRARLPSAWRCVVIVGRDAVGLHGEAERSAFAALPPVPQEISAELARIALLELLPAAVEGRFTEFAAAVAAYGRLAGKPFEQESSRLPHAAATSSLLELLHELGVAGCAQSSWGPAVVACCDSLEAAGALVDRLDQLDLSRHHDVVIGRFDTEGAKLRVVE
jgi:beta-ribofuranosylaminobenzene 5'-phosphate synthase